MMNIRKNPKTGSEEHADTYVLKYNEKGKLRGYLISTLLGNDYLYDQDVFDPSNNFINRQM